MRAAQRTERLAGETDTFQKKLQIGMQAHSVIGMGPDGKPLSAEDALGARAESLQGLRSLAASNPAAAKDYVPAIEAQRAEALSRHLAGIAPGLNATNDQVIDYMVAESPKSARSKGAWWPKTCAIFVVRWLECLSPRICHGECHRHPLSDASRCGVLL
jgi:hypothetical protein